MQMDTTRFGRLEIDPDTVITLTQPIIGFQDYRRFVLLPGPENSPLSWLQSTESDELAFLLMDPRRLIQDYNVHLNQHDFAELALSREDDLKIYTLVVVPDDPTQVRTNLKAPVLINIKQRLGKQTVLEKSDYPIQFFLAQAKTPADESAEVANARTDA